MTHSHKNHLNYYMLFLGMLLVAGCTKAAAPLPPNSPIQTTDTLPVQYGTPYSQVPDTKDISMYEINIRGFSAQHNFSGIISRLDSIKALGINVIWLMPIYPVGKLNAVGPLGSPYSVQNYEGVNPDFGGLNDLRTLVSDAHQLGMAVILDWVADHTSWDNIWISNKSWYLQNGAGDIISPPGHTWNDVAALNYNNNDMRKAMIHAMEYWILTANIDGFRCDYADGPPSDFWNQAIDSLQTTLIPHHKLILLAETANKNIFTNGFQLNYAWDYYTAVKNVFQNGLPASSLISEDSTENAGLPPGDFKLRFTSNHDEDLNDNTPLVLFNGKQGSMAAFVLVAYLGGVPLVYDGQEVGDAQQIPIFDTSSIDWTTNPDMTLTYKALLAFRNSSDAVKEGTIVSYCSPDVVAFTKTSGTQQVLVLVNVRSTSVTYTFDPAIANSVWNDAMNNNASVQLTNQLVLPPYSFRILFK